MPGLPLLSACCQRVKIGGDVSMLDSFTTRSEYLPGASPEALNNSPSVGACVW